MKNEIFWIFEFAVKDGQFDKFKDLMKEMVAATKKNEPGTIGYEWTLTEDKSQCHIHERYSDSHATVLHLTTFIEKYAGRLMELGHATRFIVYGNPDDEVRQTLDGFGAVYMQTIGGFRR